MVNVGTPAGGPIAYPTSFSINPVMAVASPSPSWIVGSHGPSLPFANSSYVVSGGGSGGHVLGYPYPGVQVVATDPASWAIPAEIYNFSRPPLPSAATNSWPSQSYYNVNQPQQHLMGGFVHQSDPGPSESSSSYNAVGANSAQAEAGLGWQQSWQMEAQESTTRDIHRREEEEDQNLMQHSTVAELEVGHDAISPDAPFRSSCHPSGLGHGERISAVQPAKIMLRGSPESTEDVDIQFNLRMTTSPRAAGELGHEDTKSIISKHEPADQEGSVAPDHTVSPRDEPASKTQCAQLCVETAENQVMADHAQDAEWPQLPSSCSADLANLSLKKSHPPEASRKLGKRIMK